jgi:hypothetical protein
LGASGIESSNLSFTAKFDVHKTPDFLEKSGVLWFLAFEKGDTEVRYPRLLNIGRARLV